MPEKHDTEKTLNNGEYTSVGSFKNKDGDLFLIYMRKFVPFLYITGDVFNWEPGHRISDKHIAIKETNITENEWDKILEILNSKNIKELRNEHN